MVTLTVEDFGEHKGETVQRFTWRTAGGLELSAISYGAIVQSIKVPDKYGVVEDVVLGFDDLQSYVERNSAYLGAAVGRCANRIAGAEFHIDGQRYQLAKNAGEDALHGGIVGFDKVNWHTTIENTKVIFSYLSKDGEEGYPGDLVTSVSYDVTEEGTFLMQFTAATTKKTVVNLTNHSYFNLAGHDAGAAELCKHVLVINADKITETTSNHIPTGRFIPVGGSPYDFRTATVLGEAMAKGEHLFDDNYCVSTYGNEGLQFVSRVSHPPSGRWLEVHSDQPGVQLYTGQALPAPGAAALRGKRGAGYRRRGALCLETQRFPDAARRAGAGGFPRALLAPGERYSHRVQYRFGADTGLEPRALVA